MKKRILSVFTVVMLLVATLAPVSAKAGTEPYVTHNLPKTIKLGDVLHKETNTKVYYHNLQVGKSVNLPGSINLDGCFTCVYGSHMGGDASPVVVGQDGIVEVNVLTELWETAIKPGTLSYQPSYAYVNDNGSSDVKLIGAPITIVIEEPVIKNNAPASVKVGTSINLNTELTNINVTNEAVSIYDNPANWDSSGAFQGSGGMHKLAYRPSVTVIDGTDIVKQTKQDYSNTLKTSETLTFNKAGTVKLKVVYNQIVTCPFCIASYTQRKAYNPEKIITITVTDSIETQPSTDTETKSESTQPSTEATTKAESTQAPTESPTESSGEASAEVSTEVATEPSGESATQKDNSSTTQDSAAVSNKETISTSDNKTGIKLDADAGVVPNNTVLKVEEVKEGGNFTIINNALHQTSDKWVAYDISLMSDNVTIQPNGKVKVTIPRPSGLNKNKMVLYHVADDGTLTKLPFEMDKTKDNITFETDHFSLYAIAEETGSNDSLVWIIAAIVAVAGVAGVAVWYFGFKKRV